MSKNLSYSAESLTLTPEILSTMGIETFQGYKETKEQKTYYFARIDYYVYSRLLRTESMRIEIYDHDEQTDTSQHILTIFLPKHTNYYKREETISQYIDEYEKEYNLGCGICRRPLPQAQTIFINESKDEDNFPVPLFICENCLPHN